MQAIHITAPISHKLLQHNAQTQPQIYSIEPQNYKLMHEFIDTY